MRISTATRSPGRTPQRAAAESLTSSMIPSGSCPGTIGSHWPPMLPLYCSTSLPQIPHASTRSSPPSSGPITGRGNSRISSCRGPVCTTARIVSLIGVFHQGASDETSSGISGTGPAAAPASGVYAQYLARAPPSTTKSHPVIRRA